MPRSQALGLAFSLIMPALVAAQEPASGLQEVVVTAQKRAESLQDTPIAITALTGESIEQFARDDVAGLAFATPSLAYSEAGGEAQLYIRGVGSNLFTVGADPSVAMNLDGIYLGRANMGLTQFLDVERVEVLRGPQGTLYGRNATGGAINIISRMPTEEFEGYGSLGFGSFDRRELRAALSGPLSERWSARVAVRGLKDDGYTDDIDPAGSNQLDDNDLKAVRSVLRWRGDSLSATLIGDYSEFDNGNTSIRPADNLGLAQTAGAVVPADFHTERNNTPSFFEWQTGGITLNVEWQLADAIDVTWVSGFRSWDSDFLFNTDGTEIEITRTTQVYDTKQYSTELRFNGSHDWGKWIAGAYYLDEDKFGALGLVRANQTGPAGGAALDPAFVPRSFIIPAQNDGEAFAFFGQVDYALADAFTLTAGIRYSEESKDDLNTQCTLLPDTELLGLFSTRPCGPNIARREASETWSAWTPKFGVEWRPTTDALLYASYTKGFKSGGFNDFQPSNPVYDPEFIKSYEIGAKTEWLDNRLRVNATAFYYDYSDLQVTAFLNSLTVTTNAADATVQGLELEVEAQPVERLNLSASVTWLDAEYDEFDAVYGTCRLNNYLLDPVNCTTVPVSTPMNPTGAYTRQIDASGNTLNNAPEWKANASARYGIPLGTGELSLFAQIAYQDRVFFNNPANDPNASQDAVTVLDARIGYVTGSGAIEVGAYGKNLTDEDYFHNIVQFTSTSDARNDIFSIGNALGYGAPGRTWGVEFTYRFGP